MTNTLAIFLVIDITLFVIIFVLIAGGIAAYFIHSYVMRKKYEKYAEKRMQIFKEKLAQINTNTKKEIEPLADEEVLIDQETINVLKTTQLQVKEPLKTTASKTTKSAKEIVKKD